MSLYSKWWNPYKSITLRLNKRETQWTALGSGATLGFLGWAKDMMPGWTKGVMIALRAYAWYIATVAGYAVLRGQCVSIYAGWWTGNRPFLVPPTVWPRRC